MAAPEPAAEPPTAAIPTGWRARWHPRAGWDRVTESAPAIVQIVVPRSVMTALGADPLWSVLALMALSLVVAVCSNVDAFFVLPFASVFMPGGIVSFLVFGAMLDLKMIALLRTTFRARTLALVLAIVALSSAALGWGMNLVA